jgi:hypothetical protein
LSRDTLLQWSIVVRNHVERLEPRLGCPVDPLAVARRAKVKQKTAKPGDDIVAKARASASDAPSTGTSVNLLLRY